MDYVHTLSDVSKYTALMDGIMDGINGQHECMALMYGINVQH